MSSTEVAQALARRERCMAGRLGALPEGGAEHLLALVESVLEVGVLAVVPHLVVDREVIYPALARAGADPALVAELEAGERALRTSLERLGPIRDRLARPTPPPSIRRTAANLLDDVHWQVERHMRSLSDVDLDSHPAIDLNALASAEARARRSVVLLAEPSVPATDSVVFRGCPARRRVVDIRLGSDRARA
jgi:hypothetical protein